MLLSLWCSVSRQWIQCTTLQLFDPIPNNNYLVLNKPIYHCLILYNMGKFVAVSTSIGTDQSIFEDVKHTVLYIRSNYITNWFRQSYDEENINMCKTQPHFNYSISTLISQENSKKSNRIGCHDYRPLPWPPPSLICWRLMSPREQRTSWCQYLPDGTLKRQEKIFTSLFLSILTPHVYCDTPTTGRRIYTFSSKIDDWEPFLFLCQNWSCSY
jgi:hypothetical protein